MGNADVIALALAGIISTLVRLATVWAPVAVFRLLILIGRLLTADKGMAFNPLI